MKEGSSSFYINRSVFGRKTLGARKDETEGKVLLPWHTNAQAGMYSSHARLCVGLCMHCTHPRTTNRRCFSPQKQQTLRLRGKWLPSRTQRRRRSLCPATCDAKCCRLEDSHSDCTVIGCCSCFFLGREKDEEIDTCLAVEEFLCCVSGCRAFLPCEWSCLYYLY